MKLLNVTQCANLRASINYEERNFSLHRLVQSVTREKQRVAFVSFVRMRQESHLGGKGMAVFISRTFVYITTYFRVVNFYESLMSPIYARFFF